MIQTHEEYVKELRSMCIMRWRRALDLYTEGSDGERRFKDEKLHRIACRFMLARGVLNDCDDKLKALADEVGIDVHDL